MLSLRNGWLSLSVRPWERDAVCSDADIGIADKNPNSDADQLRDIRRSFASPSALRESRSASASGAVSHGSRRKRRIQLNRSLESNIA